MTTKKAFLLFIVCIAVLYLPFLNNAFVSDDIQGIVDQAPTWHWYTAIGWPMNIHLSVFVQFFLYHLFGLNPWVFRLTNILFHMGSTVLVWLLVTRLSGRQRVGWATAVLFAIHPILTESVTWISGGVYAIYSFFFLASFWCYIAAREKKRISLFFLSLLFFLVALGSSEKAVTLPVIVLSYDWFFGDRETGWKNIRIRWKTWAPFVFLSLLYGIYALLRISGRVGALTASSYQPHDGFYNPILQISVAISSYVALIIWPNILTLYHSEMTFSWWNAVIRGVFTLLFLGITCWTVMRRKRIGFWLCWFIIALLPTLTPWKIAWVVAERYVYLSSIGIFVLVSTIFDTLVSIKRWKILVIIVGIAIVMALCTRTVIRNADWRTEDTLWMATAETSPSNPTTWNNMGDVYSRHGDREKAVAMFRRAIALNPKYADAYHNLGNMYLQLNTLDQADMAYRKALEINPNLWQSYRGLAVIAATRNHVDEALQYIDLALHIVPHEPTLMQLRDMISGVQRQ